MARPDAAIGEEHFFKAKHPMQDPDNWPIIDLKDVEVLTPGSKKPVNLLDSDAHNPLIVRGTVEELDDDQRKRCLQKCDVASGRRIEIAEVRQYSYGVYEDGNIELWAAGKAGWYTISPAKAHRALYDQAVEAVKLHYFIVDSTVGVPLKKQKIDQILPRFARHEKLPGGPDQARKMLRQHRRFILTCMLTGKMGLIPQQNAVFKYLEKSYNKEIDELRERIARPYVPAAASSQKAAPVQAPVVQTNRKRKRSEVIANELKAELNDIVDLTMLDDTTNIQPVSQASSEPEDSKRMRRKSARWLAEHPEDDMDLSIGPGKGKSSLRPKSTKYVGKGKGKPSIDHEEGDYADTSARGSIDMSKVPISIAPSEDEVDTRPSKRARRSSKIAPTFHRPNFATNMSLDEGIDMSLDDMEDGPIDTRPLLPPAFALHSDRIQATCDGDVWRCPLDGCLHAVYGASDSASQKLIRDHYRLHVTDEDLSNKMQLVNRMRGPGVRVDRLLSSLQAHAQAQAGQRNEVFPPRIVQRV